MWRRKRVRSTGISVKKVLADCLRFPEMRAGLGYIYSTRAN
jgi:hypothetical protein